MNARERTKGRPPRRKAKPGERVSLGLRVTSEMKATLDSAAKHSGRSQSQEAELRLERSFTSDSLIAEALELIYGRTLAGILLTLGDAMKAAGTWCGAVSDTMQPGASDWWSDPYAFDQAARAAQIALAALRPKGEIKVPWKEADPRVVAQTKDWVDDMAGAFSLAGDAYARALLGDIAGRPLSPGIEPHRHLDQARVARLRQLLGSDLVARIQAFTESRQGEGP